MLHIPINWNINLVVTNQQGELVATMEIIIAQV